MKDLRNFVQLIGNTGQEIELITFDSGSKKASVSFATTDYYKNTKGELVKQTQWHNLIAWGRNAELLQRVVQKGDQLVIKGSINYRNYTDKAGSTRYVTEILVDEFMKTSRSTSDVQEPTPSKAPKAKKEKEQLPF